MGSSPLRERGKGSGAQARQPAFRVLSTLPVHRELPFRPSFEPKTRLQYRIAMLTMVRIPPCPTSPRICDIARYPATQPPTGSDWRHIGHRRYGGVGLGGGESGRDDRP